MMLVAWLVGCLAQDPAAIALHALYESTNGEHWKSNLGWNMRVGVDESPCKWHVDDAEGRDDDDTTKYPAGLTCRNGTVHALEFFSTLAAGGTLPTELGLLTHVTSFNVQQTARMQYLSGSLPTELAVLSRLQTLAVRFTLISGTLPPGVASLTSLKRLDMHRSQLSGTVPWASLSTSLENLDIGNGLDSDGHISGTVPTQVGRFTSMTTLDFESNEFSGTMPSELGLLSSTLTSMRSGKNPPLSGTLPNQFTHLRHLWSWSCERNSVSGTLPTQMGELSFLDGLDLFKTHLSGTLPTQIGLLTRTTTNIDASSSRFSGFIPSELGMLSLNLYLRLPNNRFSGTIPARLFGKRGGWDVPGGSSFWDTMDGLRLYHNRLSGTIPSTLSNFTDLSTCELTSSQCLRYSAPVFCGDNGERNAFECPLPHNLPASCSRPEGLPACNAPAIEWHSAARRAVLALGAAPLCCFACLCFSPKRRRWWRHAVRRRLSRALLLMVPHIEMAAGTSRDSLASQDALQAMMGYAADGIEAGHGPSIDGADEMVAAAPDGTDDRLLHMIKGLAGSALSASQVVQQQLDSNMTASDRRRAQLLAGSATSALSEAIEYLVSRQVFSDLERGRYMTRKLDGNVRQLLQSVLPEGEGIITVQGDVGDEPDRLRLMYDPVLLRMILHEAIANSRKYRDAETPIHISAWFERTQSDADQGGNEGEKEGILHVSVENQNPEGARRLSDEDCLSVFERGVIGPQATSTSTGLGLDTARKAAVAAGGSVRLSTRAADDDMRRVYTTLHVEMPAATNTLSRNVLALGSAAVRVWRQDERESDGASSYAESSKGPSGNGSSITSTIASFKTAVGSSSGGVRSESSAHTDSQEEESVCAVLPHGLAIVVADDLRVNRFILSYHLASICPGSTIHECSSGEEVLQLASDMASVERPLGFDLYCIDEHMGDGLSGSGVLARLRRAQQAVVWKLGSAAPRCVLVSVTAGVGDPALERQLREAGADLVWSKPLPTDFEMARTLKAAFSKAPSSVASSMADVSGGSTGSDSDALSASS